MKKSALLATGLVLALLSLAGCYDSSSATGVIFSAYNSIEKGHLHDFRAVLEGDALTAYGNAAGMAALKAKLAAYQNVSIGQPTLLMSGDESGTYPLLATPKGQISGYVTIGTVEVGCSSSPAVYVPGETRCEQNAQFEDCTIDAINLN